MPSFETEFEKHFATALSRLRQQGSAAALEYIERLEDADFRDRTFDRIAQFLAAESNLADALRFSASIKRPRERADAFLAIGSILRQRRDANDAKAVLQQAIEAAELVKDRDDKGALFLQIADQTADIGRAEEARALLNRAVELAGAVPQSFGAAKVLRGCARLLALWSSVPEAIAVAEKMDRQWPELRQSTLDEIQGRGEWPVRPKSG